MFLVFSGEFVTVVVCAVDAPQNVFTSQIAKYLVGNQKIKVSQLHLLCEFENLIFPLPLDGELIFFP